MRVLDLFSGIGGFSYGLQLAGGFETVQFVEIDRYCQRVIAKNFPGVPIHDDIRTFRGVYGGADLICGGFPCQPFSHAGKRRGKADDRDLWPEMARVIAEVRPDWVLGENVAGFVQMELDRSLSDLESLGYTCQAFVIPACAVDAPHRRDRVWIVGNANGNGKPACAFDAGVGELQSAVADSRRTRLQGYARDDEAGPRRTGSQRRSTGKGRLHGGADTTLRWLPESGIRRVAHGIPARVDRLRGLGNAVVPQVVAEIGRAIMKASA